MHTLDWSFWMRDELRTTREVSNKQLLPLQEAFRFPVAAELSEGGSGVGQGRGVVGVEGHCSLVARHRLFVLTWEGFGFG